MTSDEIRKKYLEFFKKREHAVIPSASLIPENDPTVLFTTAGMHPLVPYLLGEKHPQGNRLTDVQKCVRTGDIDEVGDYSHHTFFEMLGNWSLGDYFKKEAIEWSYEFLTSPKWLGLDKSRIAVSVFAGDDDAPFDSEAFETWKKLGMSEKRIAKLPKKNNWWWSPGETGPCGPDSEMFYWVGDPKKVPESFNDDNDLWLEVWNDVFMQYNKNTGGQLEPLSQKNVDTGMGLERILAVVNGFDDNYKTDLFWPIIEKIEKISGKKYESGEMSNGTIKAMRIIADHLKASVFILGDERGIAPSNNGQGYVLRRLIRRAVRYGKQLGIKFFTKEIAEVVIEMYKNVYPEILRNRDFVLSSLSAEEEKFEKTLDDAEKQERIIVAENNMLTGQGAFVLSTSYGLPLEIAKEIARENNYKIDSKIDIVYGLELKKHQELSRTASGGMFKGGLTDAGEETKRLHTATHLLNAALRQVLGPHVMQKGSNITPERLRFDFSHGEKMTDEQKKKVEGLVNSWIEAKLPVELKELPKSDAEKIATHSFNEKYGDVVKVYSIGTEGNYISREFCGGPHVKNTGELKHFKIQKEEAVSAGIRRIKAVLE